MDDEVVAQLGRINLATDESTTDNGSGGDGSRRSRQQQRRRKLPGANAIASHAIRLSSDDGSSQKKQYLVTRKDWASMPDWIVLSDERGKSRPFPPLSEDPLFCTEGGPMLLPFLPPGGTITGKGAAVVCPGGNLEFLHPREGAPIARWLAEGFGVPAFVVRYRLLPDHGLDAMRHDLGRAVQEARRLANGGPVVAFGFSAGGYLIASGSAEFASVGSAAVAGVNDRNAALPDAQALIYPCIDPDGWLLDDECGFWRAEVDTSQVRSLVDGRDRLRDGPSFVPPPPTFVCASTADWVLPASSSTPNLKSFPIVCSTSP